MDEITQAGWGLPEEANPVDQLSFRGEHLWVHGVHISSRDCPECLKRDNERCVGCSFFDPTTCPLRHDPELRCDLKAILDDYRERLAARRARQRRFISALRAELCAHGRPLHYTVLARMMADRYPALRVTESKVIKALAHYPEVFERTDEGVYQVRTA